MRLDLASGHVQTLRQAASYMPAVLAETSQRAPASGALNLDAFATSFADGGTYDELLDAPLIAAKVAIAGGTDWSTALRAQDALLTTLSLTALADARREIYQADIVSRPTITGYVRQLNVPSCARCVILAGKWFRWNEGFQRHPRCDCLHIPAAENVAGDLTTDPYKYFQSLSPREQAKVFGANNAKIIREYGGDIYRVVNVQMRGVGRVSKQVRRWGTPRKRVPVDEIVARGGTRDQVVAILKEQGYITGPQTAGGNLIGNGYERFSRPISRPVVAGSTRDRVLRARTTGVRDPLDRATMTAAERRLFDANYRLEYARRTGYLPTSITNPRGLRGSDSDRFSSFVGVPASPARLAELERALSAQLADLDARIAQGIRSDGVIAVAEASGIKVTATGTYARTVTRPTAATPSTAGAGSGARPPRPPAGRDLPEPFDPDPDAMRHALDGDAFGGGHRFGLWQPSKTEFPAWVDDRDLVEVSRIAAAKATAAGSPPVDGDRVTVFYFGVVFRVDYGRADDGAPRVRAIVPLRGDGVYQVDSSGLKKYRKDLRAGDETL